ncbi:TolC family protein [Mitsuaria sp. GD03876]|uniref:TolC family protein n=1 Tax=Mitsuaria sp. GD03876 TaxID=2975399 RepID=UPI002449C8C8|nr:TolC family protein [Mitsuaria sp. GD03876]MDH0863852.1 TolC family protein [Mitsuaria sp. GD03876]
MRRFLVPLACAALTSFPALADPGLTLDAAVQAALRQNPLLRASGHELAATDGAVRQAGLIPNPSLSLDIEDTRRETRSTSLMLSQTIELGGKRAARVELARRDRELAAADLETQRAEVRAGTIQAFFDTLIAQERVQVARESLQIAASGAQAVSRRVTAGKVSPVEDTRARVAESGARIELRLAEADLAAALRALAAAMGEAPGAIARVDGSADALPALPDGPAMDARIDQSPLLRRARLAVQRADAAFDLERTRATPDVTVGLGGKRATELGRTQPLISVSIPIPLFDRNQGAQFEALRKRDAAQALAQAEEQRLRAEVLQAVDQLQARAEEVQVLRRDVLPGAQGAYEAARRGFELGKFGFLDVLDAQRTWLQARGQYFTALSQAHRLSADIDRRLGAADARP